MNIIRFLPFFYFQNTRLNTLKSLGFHSIFEFIPSIIIVLLENGFRGNILAQLILYYLAFISIYEIGYIFNDQQAHANDGRTRSEKLSFVSLSVALTLRLFIFVLLTFLTENEGNAFWWEWYVGLAIIFSAHNLIDNPLLKCVTFSQLAFFRFLTPIVFVIQPDTTANLVAPIILNYVLFRLFTYMESKSLITIDRKSNSFRIGFYSLLMIVSILLSMTYKSFIPIGVNGYYLFVVILFAIVFGSKEVELSKKTKSY
jgi:hypothetical protein